ncbi:MAG: enoyl-CoA hydratase/isomerase family protein, partial [Actinomycetota bacterium]
LPRLIGPSRAKDIVYSGRQVKAEEALAIGLVDRLCDDPYADALETAKRYATGPRVALRAAKAAIDWGGRTDLRTGLTIEREAFSDLFATEDQKEGMRSFVEEGPGKAKFKGR